MLGAPVAPPDWSADHGAEAVAIVETRTVCAAIAAADAACKVADGHRARRAVRGRSRGQGVLHADRHARRDRGRGHRRAQAAGDRLVGLEVIAQPSPDLRGRLFR